MITVTTTRENLNATINNAVKQTIMENIDSIVEKSNLPFFQNTFLQDATFLKEQLVDSLCVGLQENFPDSFIASGGITKNSLMRALSLNVAKGEFNLIKEELEIATSSFKKNKDFIQDELSSEDEWRDDFGSLTNETESELNEIFETDSEEEEETRMYDYIEERIKDKNGFLSKLKNNTGLKRFNTLWV